MKKKDFKMLFYLTCFHYIQIERITSSDQDEKEQYLMHLARENAQV